MIIYNVTVKIEPAIREDWETWMKRVHIPDVIATNCFTDAQLRRLLIDEDDGITYSIQYRCRSMTDLEKYQNEHASRLQSEHTERYEGKYVAFRTLMEQMEEF
ncbi:MAG: DUF4286 family protein [Saprospiraceae bacterium]|nr:DUF4286 family protein [Saprospiraceae bacterium]